MDIAATLTFLARRAASQPAPFRKAQVDARVAVVLCLASIGGVGLWLARESDAALLLESAPVKLTALVPAADYTTYAMDAADSSARNTLERALDDAKVRALAAVLSSLLDDPLHAEGLFVELTIAAFRAHLDSLLRGRTTLPPPHGLAPWQERRARELLSAQAAEAPDLHEVAKACRLSLSHFTRAFRCSTGMPPHRWLMQHRVERSKHMLVEQPHRALADIALTCGFSDQSHFSRTFARLTGTTPGTWRRGCAMSA